MARLSEATPAQLEQVSAELKAAAAAMGFTPNSMKIMARRPEILRGFLAFAGAILGPGGTLEPSLRQMIAHVASASAGCRYCQAHTAEQAHRAGLADDKIEVLWSYETSPLFSAAERAALSLAQAAASVPNDATDAQFDALKAHFSDDQIAEIVAVVALFGFLNRWNDTLATPLEEGPLAFAEAHLTAGGWAAGAHVIGSN